MFTGIVETTGVLKSKSVSGKVHCLRFSVTGIQDDMKTGDSLSVNGVCLTVVSFGKNFVEVEVVSATLKSTCLGQLRRGDRVNLERSLKVGDRLGGHWVQGHVDGVGRVRRRLKKGKNVELEIEAPKRITEYLVPKASVAVNGASLTLQSLALKKSFFTVAIIPHTLKMTSFSALKAHDAVNLEVDILAKYVRKSLSH